MFQSHECSQAGSMAGMVIEVVVVDVAENDEDLLPRLLFRIGLQTLELAIV